MSIRKTVTIAFAALAALAGSALLSVPAFAFETYDEGSPFVGGKEGSGNGEFKEPVGVAVNRSHDVLVLDAGNHRVQVFDSSGAYLGQFNGSETPAKEFSALSGNGIAVDDSSEPGDPSAGDVYVVDAANDVIDKFAPKAGHEGEYEYIYQLTGFGGAIGGIAVGPDGEVWATEGASAVQEFTNGGENTSIRHVTTFRREEGVEVYFFVLVSGAGIAVDKSGFFYAGGTSSVTGGKIGLFNPEEPYTKADGLEGPINLVQNNQNFENIEVMQGLAVDESTNLPFVNEGGQIRTPDASASGERIFGEASLHSAGVGLAVDPIDHDVYAGDTATNGVDVFKVVFEPDVTTGTALVKQTSATLVGTVDPDGEAITACEFEYSATQSSSGGLGGEVKTAPCQETPAGDHPVTVEAEIGGLEVDAPIYYRLIAADVHGQREGSQQTLTTLPDPPQLTGTLAASELTPDSASISSSAFVNPGKGATYYHYVYGTSTEYGSSTPEVFTGAGTEPVAVPSQFIGGLQPDTTYHYALVASNRAQTVVGPDGTFTTAPPIAPSLVTGAPGGVSQSAATLTGSVDPEGLQASYGFEYGEGAGEYTARVALGSFGVGTEGAQQISYPLSFLGEGTTYHYRVYASNQFGTAYGADVSFATPVYANPLSIPNEPGEIAGVSSFVFPQEGRAVAGGGAGKTSKSKSKSPSRAQELARALKACGKKPKSRRAACEKQARGRYAPVGKSRKRRR
jgi:hypothetical protein